MVVVVYQRSSEEWNSSQKFVFRYEHSSKLKDVEDELLIGTRLAVKTHKETKRMALMDVIASAKARVGNLNTSIQEGIYLLVEEFTSILQEALAS
ncbi:hypothetical protein P8452_08666 [Trifolium repens]|nr:hypothetical protein P8452_08666 [Trifolium repens]